jgi:hypothetical protein
VFFFPFAFVIQGTISSASWIYNNGDVVIFPDPEDMKNYAA